MNERQFYFETYCKGGAFFGAGWQRQPGEFASFVLAQQAAIENGVRPYRVKEEAKEAPGGRIVMPTEREQRIVLTEGALAQLARAEAAQ